MVSPQARFAHFLLRLGAAFAFAYPAVNAWFDPGSWIGYFPPFVLSFGESIGVSNEILLHLFGAVEILLALWILSGYKLFWPSLVATAMLLTIVVFNLPQMQIVFRDLSIAALTFALALMHLPLKGVGLPARYD